MFQPLWVSLTTLGMGAATWIVVAMFGGRRVPAAIGAVAGRKAAAAR